VFIICFLTKVHVPKSIDLFSTATIEKANEDIHKVPILLFLIANIKPSKKASPRPCSFACWACCYRLYSFSASSELIFVPRFAKEVSRHYQKFKWIDAPPPPLTDRQTHTHTHTHTQNVKNQRHAALCFRLTEFSAAFLVPL